VIAFERTTDPYSEGLRGRIVNEFSKELGPDGWWLKLDADEFLESDPRSAIRSAQQVGANAIRAWQIQFAFTDVDRLLWEAGIDDEGAPIDERRRYYHLDWRETRLWQNQPDSIWSDLTSPTPPGLDRHTRTSLFNRHYQHRSPQQMQRRIDLRRGSPNFPHEQLDDWQDLVQPADGCHLRVEGQRWHFDWRLFAANKLSAKSRQTMSTLRGRNRPALTAR
jgi:hypothetical protein